MTVFAQFTIIHPTFNLNIYPFASNNATNYSAYSHWYPIIKTLPSGVHSYGIWHCTSEQSDPNIWVKVVLSKGQDLFTHRCITSQRQKP